MGDIAIPNPGFPPRRIRDRVVDRDLHKDALVPEIASRGEQGLLLCAIGIVAFGGLDWLLRNPEPALLSAVKLAQLFFLVVAGIALRTTQRRDRILFAIGIALAALYLGTPVSGALIGDFTTAPLVFCVLAIASASLLPWGIRAQACSLLPVAVVVSWSLLRGRGLGIPLDTTALTTLVFALGCSLFLASQTETQRLLQAQVDETEQALRESEARRAAVVSTALDGMLVADETGVIVEFNRAAEWMFGVQREEALGKSLGELLLPERLRKTKAAAWTTLLASSEGSTNGAAEELTARRADDSEFPAEFTVARSEWRGRPILVVQVRDISRRRSIEDELRRLQRDLEGTVQSRTSQLDLANKELETLAYSVSHDLRTPLRTIEGFAEILVSEHQRELGAEADEHLHRIRDAAKRMSQLLNGVLALSRVVRGDLRPEPVDLSRLAAQVVAERRAREPDRDIEVQIEDGLSTFGDPRLLRSLLEHLVGNAFHYTRDSARARIDIGERDGEFFVEDNGCGFDPAYAGKLFQPFTRLHEDRDHEGCGIGLATVARIARRHGGSVRAEAAVDRGATIYFRLPRGEAGTPPTSVA